MDKAVQVCISCNTSLAIGLKLHFCPYCGTAQLEKKLLEQKTTQHFDPDNPSHKPWREKSRLPKRNYKNAPSKKPQPWCPPMRQLRIRPAKSKASKQVREEQANSATEDDRPNETCEGDRDFAEYGEAVESMQEADRTTHNEANQQTQPETYLGFYTESTCPIAIYDAEHWLAIGGMAVNISLVQQTLGQSNHGYWLRVGVMFDEDERIEENNQKSPASGTGLGAKSNDQSNDEAIPRREDTSEYTGDLNSTPDPELSQAGEGEDEGQQYIIAVLSSDTAKLMVPRVEDWVDLCAIDPTEYYMARHMEKVLESIAHRVVTTNLNELACRQEYSVEMRRRTKQTKLSSTLQAVNGLISAAVIERMSMHTSSVAWGYNANQVVCKEVSDNSTAGSSSPSRGGIMTRTRTSISVSFLDWVIQLSHKLALTRGISIRYIPAVVRLSFRYDSRLCDPLEFQNSAQVSTPTSSRPTSRATSRPVSRPMTPNRSGKSSVDGTVVGEGGDGVEEKYSSDSVAAIEAEVNTGKYVDPRVMEKKRTMRRFAESQRVTHVVLNIIPVAISAEEVVPPAVLSFDLASLKTLLKDSAPLSIDELLADAKKKELSRMAKRLASLVRLEYTNNGIKYAVVGVFSEPTHISCGWPMDQVNLDDDSDIDLEDPSPPAAVEVPPESVLIEEAEEANTEFPEDAVFATTENMVKLPPTQEEDLPEIVVISPRQPTPRRPDAPVLCGLCTCPLHPTLPASAPCKCLRREVTVKGSSLWVYGDFSGLDSGVTSSAGGDLSEELCSLSDVRELAGSGSIVKCANSVTLLAVDQTDESLTSKVSLSAAELTSLLRRTAQAAVRESDATQRMEPHTVNDTAAVVILDVLKQPRLLDELYSVICSDAHLDLFLSRKSRLMKISIK